MCPSLEDPLLNFAIQYQTIVCAHPLRSVPEWALCSIFIAPLISIYHTLTRFLALSLRLSFSGPLKCHLILNSKAVIHSPGVVRLKPKPFLALLAALPAAGCKTLRKTNPPDLREIKFQLGGGKKKRRLDSSNTRIIESDILLTPFLLLYTKGLIFLLTAIFQITWHEICSKSSALFYTEGQRWEIC